MVILKVEKISKTFGSVTALNKVDLKLSRGEILGILGPNGAGKTTLIHCLLGLIIPTEGEIEVLGMNMQNKRVEILRHMNFASSEVSLPMTLTPFENLKVYALLYSVPQYKERCLELLRLFDILSLKDISTRKLSSGQMMRLRLAKSLINKPDILLLDEPTAGLDPEIAKKTRELLIRLRDQEGLSVIYTSHNLREVEEVSNRILFLNKGVIIAEGNTDDLKGRYRAGDIEEIFFKIIKDETVMNR